MITSRLNTCSFFVMASAITWGQSILFNFDNVSVYTPFPIDVSVGGVTAHLSGQGQGYSIQSGSTAYNPAGFSGNFIYPSSVYQSDLTITYTKILKGFSIIYAPQELECDSSARMRVTAYMGITPVGTNTAVAYPPGTWPRGTLSINVPQGFNKVIVHYDAPPPTGGDWGPIFMADDMTITLAETVSGHVSFGSRVASYPTALDIDYENPITHAVVYTAHGVTVDGSGNFATADRPPVSGQYIASIQKQPWLRKNSQVINTTSSVAGLDFTLINGDVVADNEVNLADYSALAVAFGSVPGDPNWNTNADLDGDLEVTLVDYSILSNNFGAIGDE